MKRKEVVWQVLLPGNSGALVALPSVSPHSSIFLLGLSTFTSCRSPPTPLTPLTPPESSTRRLHKRIRTLLCQKYDIVMETHKPFCPSLGDADMSPRANRCAIHYARRESLLNIIDI